MAITIDQFHTELEAVKTALASLDYSTARLQLTNAELTLSGLEMNVGAAGSFAQQRKDLAHLAKRIDGLENASNRRSDKKRFIRTRTGYGNRRGGRYHGRSGWC